MDKNEILYKLQKYEQKSHIYRNLLYQCGGGGELAKIMCRRKPNPTRTYPNNYVEICRYTVFDGQFGQSVSIPVFNLTQYPLVNQMNNFICNYMIQNLHFLYPCNDLQEAYFSVTDRNEFIHICTSKFILWRRCTGMIVVQISNFGPKILFYALDYIMHSAESFGTTCNLIDSDVKDIVKSVFLNMKNAKNAHIRELLKNVEYSDNILFLS